MYDWNGTHVADSEVWGAESKFKESGEQTETLDFKSSVVNESLGNLTVRMFGEASEGVGPHSQPCVFTVPPVANLEPSSSSKFPL